jgi:ABC-2 type transport system ATP-binding protein
MSEAPGELTRPALSARGLTKRFGDVLAVEALTLSIQPGEIFGLLGPNGAGKTTTIRMLSALIAPTSGEAWVAGHPLGERDRAIRRSVGILTESPGLYDRLSAERNLAFFARLYEVDEVAGQVERYLRMLDLWDRRQEAVGTFSKGMRQKLAIARALLHEPQILYLDEPTSGLDPEAARLVREFIGGLKRAGRTILMCTHNLGEADRLCDRIAVIKTRILALDTPAALRRELYGRSVVFHLRAADGAYAQALERHPAVQEVNQLEDKLVVTLEDPETHNPALIRALVDAGAEIQFVGELRRTLEDVYLQLMSASDATRGERVPPRGEARSAR